jgi:hypothetical protein
MVENMYYCMHPPMHPQETDVNRDDACLRNRILSTALRQGDALACYCGVLRALSLLRSHGARLGPILNGITRCDDATLRAVMPVHPLAQAQGTQAERDAQTSSQCFNRRAMSVSALTSDLNFPLRSQYYFLTEWSLSLGRWYYACTTRPSREVYSCHGTWAKPPHEQHPSHSRHRQCAVVNYIRISDASGKQVTHFRTPNVRAEQLVPYCVDVSHGDNTNERELLCETCCHFFTSYNEHRSCRRLQKLFWI